MKRLLSVLLIAIMAISCMSTAAFADELDGSGPGAGNEIITDGGENGGDGAGTQTPGEGTENPGSGTETPGSGTENPGTEVDPPVDPAVETGWNEAHNMYYVLNEEGQAVPVTGLQTIEGSVYYFNASGIMQTGTVKVNGKMYVFAANGKGITNKGWFTDSVGKRYGLGNGQIAMGIKTISGKGYYFSAANGVVRTATGFFNYNNESYYTKKGVLVTGWQAINDKAYYFRKGDNRKYSQAKDTKVKYLKIPKCGYLGKAYALGIKKLNKSGWTLEKAYKNSYKMRYAHRWMRKKSSEAYAVYGFTNNKGNCYCMAATFYIQAKLLGYNIRQIEGKVAYRAPHSWTQIKQNGKWYVYDPNFRNETGRNGWKIYYGKKGTWRYTNYHVFQN